MIANYFKTAWRNLVKNKAFSLINISGLTIGITVCLMIFLFILNEFTADGFHKNGDRIYRVMRGFENEGKTSSVGYLSGRYAPALTNDFKGDIEAAVRLNEDEGLVSIGNRSFREKKMINADSNFFSFFTFPLLKGNPETAMQNPHSVVLTETTARKYFGSIDKAFGQTIVLNKDLPLTVTGIARDVPSNSHIEFDLVIPLENYKDRGWMTVWINNAVYTYIRLSPRASKARIEKQFPAFVEKYLGGDLKKFGFHWTLSLTPLTDVYLDDAAFDGVRHGSKTVVYIFLSIAVLILLIACINFMNLSTIRAAERSKEVGLRKVLGALRRNLIGQFIGESILMTSLSCLLSLFILVLVMPYYNRLLGHPLTVSWNTPPIYLFLAGIIITVGILAGCYPAFFLSAFSPIQALKGKLRLGKGGSSFRQALVVVQFSISVFLIVGTIVISKQMNYVRNKKLGYNKDQTVLIRIDNDDLYNGLITFKNQLQQSRDVKSVSLMSGEPGGFFDNYTFDVQDHAEKWNARTEFADFEFVKTLGLDIIAGRDFSASFPTDSTDAVIINRTAAAKLGWSPDQALGKWIQNTVRDNEKRKIIGVVADFNFQSLKQQVEPLVIAPNIDRRVILVKLQPGHIRTGLSTISKAYQGVASGFPFDYRFLDDQFNDLYKKDLRQQTILSVFAILAILVASLGLFGLTSFAASKRYKEIGVRKVLGSSVPGIVALLSKDLLKPVIIATFIAIPAGYYAMDKWLQNFAYQTGLSWWIFAAAAMITVAIALLTIGMKATKAAMANPVDSLRSE